MTRAIKFCRKQRCVIASAAILATFLGATLANFGLSVRLQSELTKEVCIESSNPDRAQTPPPESMNGGQGLSLQPVWLSTVLEEPMRCDGRMALSLLDSERSGFHPLLERPPRA